MKTKMPAIIHLSTMSFFLILVSCTMNAEDNLAAPESSPFEYVSGEKGADGSVCFTVTEEGLSKIELGKDVVASGKWEFLDASWREIPWRISKGKIPRPNSEDWTISWTSKKMESRTADSVRVRHESENFTAIFDYKFNGEDVRIKARIENNHPEKTVSIVEFSGLKFLFSAETNGYMMQDPNPNELIARNRGTHPSFDNLIGGSYAQDGRMGVGFSPIYKELEQTLFWWRPADKNDSNCRAVSYMDKCRIPPGGALTFEMNLRISRNCDWKHLLTPYREHFEKCFGPITYKQDFRPVGQYQAANEKAISPENPSGWQWYKFDKETDPGQRGGGFLDFASSSIPLLQKANAQGVIIWEFRGSTTRKCTFRPDFDVLPPEVEKILPSVMEKFKSAGMKMGTLARPGEIVSPKTWTEDAVVRFSAELDSPDKWTGMTLMFNRFENMDKRGFSFYYLDTFGSFYEDIKIMKQLREKLGPEILTYSEYWTDVLLVYSGAYMQLTWDAEKMTYGEYWRRGQAWEICRWLIPGVQGLTTASDADMKMRELNGKFNFNNIQGGWMEVSAKDNAEASKIEDGSLKKGEVHKIPSPFRYMFENGMTPLFYIGSSKSGPWADELSLLTAEYVDDKGLLRNTK